MSKKTSSTPVDSIIDAVTVYADRALIKRIARITLSPGEHQLLFDDLPEGLIQDSIQVQGQGDAVLNDIRFQKEYYTQNPDQDIQTLFQEKKDLQQEEQSITDTLARLEKEKVYMDGILQKLTQPSKKSSEREHDPSNWVQIMDFYRERQASLDEERRSAHLSLQEIQAHIKKIDQHLREFSTRHSRARNQVVVSVDVRTEKELSLTLSYIIPGPSWVPVYDIRVDSEQKNLELSYQALISQSTSEDWDDVEISLSTAQVQLYGREPELDPWYIDFYHPAPPPRPLMRSAGMQAKAKKALPDYEEEDALADNFVMSGSAPAPEPSVEMPAVSVETRASSVEFHIQARTSIHSDGNAHKAGILTHSLPASFHYSSTPRLSAHAFLQAAVKNETDFPLLAGETHIFMDNAFVANASIDTTAPNEEFDLFLGVDESIRVEHKLIKRFNKNEGLIGKKKKIIYQYLIHLHNLKQTEEKIVIKDQIPVSMQQDIVVHLIEPAYKQDTETLKKSEQDFLEWHIDLGPGQETDLRLEFSVEYPERSQIQGL